MLVRQASAGTIEVYLTRRHARSRFMPDAFVFPGGAVEAADAAIGAERLDGLTTAPAELVVAAVRETFEEAGILLAGNATGVLAAADVNAARSALLAGESFAHILERYDLRIDAARLAYYSNWITPPSEPIRFDAHFFIARAPADQIATADTTEVYDGVWLHPEAALARGELGEMTIRFPTRKHLERLAAFTNVDALLAAARARTVKPVAPTEEPDGTFQFDEAAW
jgi:8-oxo-dGTP pyrophosphatase MutT (NUDIX family)